MWQIVAVPNAMRLGRAGEGKGMAAERIGSGRGKAVTG